ADTLLGEIPYQELCLRPIRLNWPERLVQFNLDQVKSLSVVFADIVPFDHVKGHLEVFLDTCFEHSRSQLASAFHADSFQGRSTRLPVTRRRFPFLVEGWDEILYLLRIHSH